MKSKFNIKDTVIHENEIGTITNKQLLYHIDEYIYMVKFDEVEIVLRENELEKYNG